MLKRGEWVWVDSGIGVPIGARVKETPTGQRLLVDDEGNEQRLTPELEASLRIMHPTSVEGVDDMIKLGDMTEAGLLRNLLLRHRQGSFYTYTGSVLVAVNPYKDFPIYTAEQVNLYHGRKLGELPPHIFAIGESCYFNMTRHRKNQCCIISGETGAGKTESTKLILQYLAAVSGGLSEQRLEQQILESNPILEAFGNAKTIHNDNSSRFGKYLEIFFNADGVIEGARVEQYLLEKSRVCHQARAERNYHIFYCLLKGLAAEEKKALKLGDANEYKFLTKGECISCDGRDDAKDYSRIHSAMKILTFSTSQCEEILKLLAAILHLGNISFEATTQNNLETSDVGKSNHLSVAASLLEVQPPSLVKSLTHRSFHTNREQVTKPLNCEQAADCRDAFVKAIYNKLFIWIVEKINRVTYKKFSNGPKSSYQSIGLLDIFGFENFKTNSFEQLCINFANEKLQQFFVAHIFKLEQEECLKEGIAWNSIDFSDNQNILDLLAGKPCNLLALIDEESHFPKGTDATMLNKMNRQHSNDKAFVAKSEYDTSFGVKHFSGLVIYESKGFLEKNRDAVSDDLVKLIETTTGKLLRRIFESELSTNGVKVTKNAKVIMTPRNSMRTQTDKRKLMPTLSGQFRQSLDSLMKALSACQPYFIRCFKPNSQKKSEVFDRALCMRQLRYSGMMDTIHIRNLGYAIRHTFEEFLSRYRVLLRTAICNPNTETAASCCEAICRAAIEDCNEWKIGKTKIFVKDAHDAILEKLREQELCRVALVIQRVVRGNKDRKTFLKKRQAAVVLQSRWRGYREKQLYQKLKHGFGRLVSVSRGRKLRRQYQRQRKAALTIQTQIRGYQARKRWGQKRQAAVLLQAHTRGLLARRAFRKMKNDDFTARLEKESWEQIAVTLQQGLEELQSTDEEPELKSESREESDFENAFKFQPPPVVGDAQAPEASEPDEFEMRQDLQEAAEDASGETSGSELEIVAPRSVTPIPSKEEDEDEFEDEADELSFSKFASDHFQGEVSHKHINQRLRQPLLHHGDEGDALACLTVWWIILRFMGDIPEPKALDAISQASSPRLARLPQRPGRRLSHLVGLDQKIMRKNKNKYGGGHRRASTILEEAENLTEDEDILIGEGPSLDRPLSPLEKLHIIVGYALSRPDIRDEIYCQICKQLVNNNNRNSRLQGWTLLSICLGIFPPTELFVKCLQRFVSRGPSGYGEYCSERLRRTLANGERKELPCLIELQAAQAKEPIDVHVTLTDDSTVALHLESASTSAEVCQAVAQRTGLTDTYGFSLYISMYDKMWSLGSCGNHVLDAVSQCEQELRRQGKEERDAPWSLSLRKELFTPWHDSLADRVSTGLIYQQVIKDIKSGECVSEKEDDYVQFAVKHYYVRFGPEQSRENARRVVEECITTPLIESKSMAKWIQLISSASSLAPSLKEKPSRGHVEKELVDSARDKWPLHFSKFYEVTMMSGPPLPKSRFVVAVNWKGVFFMDGREKKLTELSYLEVKEVTTLNVNHGSSQSMNLSTIHGDFVLRCAEAVDMAALIGTNIEGLRQRSVYALVQQDIDQTDDDDFLECKRGDLLLLERHEDRSSEQKWIRAKNHRSDNIGSVFKDKVQFLPTLSKPTEDMLELLNEGHRKRSTAQSAPQRDETVAPVSLKEFALENFRTVGKDPGRPGLSRVFSREKLWASSREPLRQPLLRSLVRNSELSYLACNASLAILKYMGDYPIKHARSPMELTDQIFAPATQHQVLQDEIYCQIMRQMTSNINRLSVERGWQLMWLCSGLFPPSPSLMKHTQNFLESRPRDPLAAVCLQRLQAMRRKEPRKLPPHMVEVDAIQQNSTQIFHKVHFPDNTAEIYEVTSTTSIRDLCCSVASQLSLQSSPDGFGLYLKTQHKMTSIDEQKYFFDSLRESADLTKKPKKAKEGYHGNIPYLVIFKRKLWFNVTPGKDEVADLTFHFPQEMPKYLRGHHRCTKEDMITLGGLLFRSKVDSDRKQFVMIPKMLKDLVPADEIKSMSADDWKKNIISSYNKQSGITVQEAKIAFLKIISTWPTFGCAFFNVKQTGEHDLPQAVTMAISKQGVSMIDPKSKELLEMYPFKRIPEYRSKGSVLQMTISTGLKEKRLVCETAQAATIEDLLRSYVVMYERQTESFRTRSNIFP